MIERLFKPLCVKVLYAVREQQFPPLSNTLKLFYYCMHLFKSHVQKVLKHHARTYNYPRFER